MIKFFVDLLIAVAARHPYSHLYHADGSVYMRRFWLLPEFFLQRVVDADAYGGYWELKWWARRLLAFRLHHIVTPDYDPHFHDHPWSFVSLVMRGWYVEHRPVSIEPHFVGRQELSFIVLRAPGSLALRRCTDRHRITAVAKETWTLVALGPKRQWWGFYAPTGKIHYADYPSVHNLHARSEGT